MKETDCQIAVPYEGRELQPFTKYTVRLEAEDDAGECAQASTEFETGRMDTIWTDVGSRMEDISSRRRKFLPKQ